MPQENIRQLESLAGVEVEQGVLVVHWELKGETGHADFLSRPTGVKRQAISETQAVRVEGLAVVETGLEYGRAKSGRGGNVLSRYFLIFCASCILTLSIRRKVIKESPILASIQCCPCEVPPRRISCYYQCHIGHC